MTAGLEGMEVPLRVAVMGCVVNGPGEAREADLGVASGNGKGQIFVKGEVIKTVPESQIVETLIEEAMRIAEGMEAVEGGRRASASAHSRLERRHEAAGTACRIDPRTAPACCPAPPRVRVLGIADLADFLRLAARDPVVNVFADYRARTTNLEPRWLGGEIWGRYADGELTAACHVGANLVPVQATEDDARVFAERALTRGRSVSTIVGPQPAVAACGTASPPPGVGPARCAGTSPTWRSTGPPHRRARPGGAARRRSTT